jgi:nitrate/nitrite transporter NarK
MGGARTAGGALPDRYGRVLSSSLLLLLLLHVLGFVLGNEMRGGERCAISHRYAFFIYLLFFFSLSCGLFSHCVT